MIVHDQTLCFLYAVILGLIYGCAWDLNSLFRGVKRKSVRGFVWDCLYCIGLSASFFLFVLRFCGGQIRGFTIVGILLGCTLYILSLRDIFMAILWPFLKIWEQVCKIPKIFHRILQKFR